MQYHKKFEKIRLSQGLTLEKLAKKIGVTSRGLHYWEKGHREPSIGNFIKWAKALGLKLIIEN